MACDEPRAASHSGNDSPDGIPVRRVLRARAIVLNSLKKVTSMVSVHVHFTGWGNHFGHG